MAVRTLRSLLAVPRVKGEHDLLVADDVAQQITFLAASIAEDVDPDGGVNQNHRGRA